jgi:hypothetical protein
MDEYEHIDKIKVLEPLHQFIKTTLSAPLPEGASPSIIMGYYTRGSSTHIRAPGNNCALRILFNLGFADTYIFEPVTDLPENKMYLTENTYVILGPVSKCNHKIYIDHSIYIKVPPKNPGGPEGSQIRDRNYRRITVIFDFLINKDILDDLTKIVADKIPSIKLTEGTSKKNIEDHIKRVKEKVMQDEEMKKKLRELNTPGGPKEPEKSEVPNISTAPSGVPEENSKNDNTISDFEREVLESMNPTEREEMMKMLNQTVDGNR